ARDLAARIAGDSLAHLDVVMEKQVEPEVVREILRSDHQAKRRGAGGVTACSRGLVGGRNLLRAYEEEKSKQHEEDQERVFFADAIVCDRVDADGPESRRQQRVPAIKESGGQKEERDYSQRTDEGVWQSQRGFLTVAGAGAQRRP